jgi:hypothetical protein
MNNDDTAENQTVVANKSWIVGLSKDAIFWTSVVYALLAFIILVLYG